MRHLKVNGIEIAENYAIVDFNVNKTNVIVYKSGSFCVNRVFAYGLNSLYGRLKDKLSLDKKEADKLLAESNADTSENPPGEALRILRSFLDSISADIMKVLDFYHDRNDLNSVSAVYAGGSLPAAPGICSYLSSQLKLPVTSLSGLTDYMLKKKPEAADLSGVIGVTFREEYKK